MRRLNRYKYCFLFIFFILLLENNSYSQAKKKETARFTLYGKIVLDDKPVENVSLEIFKNGQFQRKILTTKNGKYSFSMNQDTLNQKNEFTIHITKEGTVPKTVVVNTYVPREQYDDTPYEYVLEITLLTTTVNDVVIQRPSAKIKWIESEEGFGIDKVYAKIVQREEEKLKEDPDKYLKELAKKQDEEERIKRQLAEEQIKAELASKAEEERNRLEEEKEREATANKLKENVKAITAELKDITKSDSVIKRTPEPIDQSSVKVVQAPVKEEVYDESKNYELKKDKVQLIKAKEAAEKKKKANLATKYETRNAMSSLLDAVDEHDKRMKRK